MKFKAMQQAALRAPLARAHAVDPTKYFVPLRGGWVVGLTVNR